jgi:hypothetical protein
MIPNTSRGWALALAAVHPDGPTPDVARYLDLCDQRAEWRVMHGQCARDGCVKLFTRGQHTGTRHCSHHCANLVMAEQRRVRRLLVGEVPQVDISAEQRHARHSAVFGVFSRCQHTACVRARKAA